MKKIMIFLSLLIPVAAFAQENYVNGKIYKISANLSLKCRTSYTTVGLYEANRPTFSFIAASYPDDLSEDDIYDIERSNMKISNQQLLDALYETFTQAEIDRFAANGSTLHLGFTFDDLGKNLFVSFSFRKTTTDFMTLPPTKFGILHEKLMKIPFHIVDKRLKYNNGGIDVNMKVVKSRGMLDKNILP